MSDRLVSGPTNTMPPQAHWREYAFPFLLALACALLGSIPYLYAYWSQPAGEIFMGFVGRGTPGANGYFMLARQVQEGYHLTENLLTPEPLPRNYFNVEWWLTGKAAAWTGLSLEGVHHLDRVLSVFGFCLAAYYLASLLITSVFWRRVATAIICLGSGFGWLIILVNRFGLDLPLPLDVAGVQVFGYLVNKPHFIRAGLFAILTYAFVIEGLRRRQMRWFVFSGLMALCHSSIRPYHIIELHILYGTLPALLAWRDQDWSLRRFVPFAVAGGVHFPAVVYYLIYMYLGSLGMSGWERVPGYLIQDILWMSWPFLVFVATAPFFLRLHHQRDETIVLTAWIIVAWLICQLYPYWGAGLESAFFAFCVVPPILIFAGPAMWFGDWLAGRPQWVRYWKPGYRLPLALALVVVALPSSAYVYRDMFVSLHRDHPHWTFYLSEPVYETLHWIRDNLPEGRVVLASHDTSQFIPRFSNHKVVTGHDMLTANYDEKNWFVSQFFADEPETGPNLRPYVIRQFQVSYVLVGPLEREHGSPDFGQFPWLDLIHENGPVRLYAVLHDRLRESL